VQLPHPSNLFVSPYSCIVSKLLACIFLRWLGSACCCDIWTVPFVLLGFLLGEYMEFSLYFRSLNPIVVLFSAPPPAAPLFLRDQFSMRHHDQYSHRDMRPHASFGLLVDIHSGESNGLTSSISDQVADFGTPPLP